MGFRAISRAIAVLSAVAIMGACSAQDVAPRAFEESKCTPDGAWPPVDQALGDEILRLTNEHRADLGAPQLSYLPVLQNAAIWKARHMAQGSYMAHEDKAPPIDRSFSQRVKDCGFSGGAAENVAMGYRTPADVFEGWLGSSGHRNNIENPAYNVTGMAAAIDSQGDPYWVQIFGFSDGAGSGDAATPVAEEPSAPADDSEGSVNLPPVAQPDRASVRAGGRTRVGVLSNDSDPEGARITLLSVGPAAFGRASIDAATGSILYRAKSGAKGKRERLAYTITDEQGETAESVLVITIK